MDNKRREGRETWDRLLQWDKQQAPAERLAGHVLRFDGFNALDPSHPLGGKDGLKDIIAVRDEKKWIAGAYFPRGQKSFTDIKNKFIGDSSGIVDNNAQGFIFITNQELRLAEREELSKLIEGFSVEIYHLERISSILDSPQAYGVRLEFLDIPMTKEDQVSFFAWLESKNTAAISAAFQTERRILAEEQYRKSKVALRNHSVILFPIIRNFRLLVYYVTTPQNKRVPNTKLLYNPDFSFSDLQDVYKPAFLLKFPHYEPAVERYIKIHKELLAELISLVKIVDHTHWPDIPRLCQEVIILGRESDYSELILSTEKMVTGKQPTREFDAEMLKNNTEKVITFKHSSALTAYSALALQIKGTMPILDKIESTINENIA